MKQLLKASFLIIVLFLATPAFAEGDMGAGGRPGTNGVKTTEPTEISKSLDSTNRQENSPEDFFSWVYKQIFELIG